MSGISERIDRIRAIHAARNQNAARVETRADLYQRASAEAFAALQQAALDALDTARLVAGAIEMLESSTTIHPDERTSIIARLQQIPAARDGSADQSNTQEEAT